jgi:hypothetical protein
MHNGEHNKPYSLEQELELDQEVHPAALSSKPLPAGDVLPRIRSAEEREIRFHLKLIRDVLRTEHPTSLPDLVEAVKVRCARARIPYGHGEIHRALDRIEHQLHF